MKPNYNKLLDELSQMFPHPFDWMGGLRRPHWYALRYKYHRNRIKRVFEKHGLELTDNNVNKFMNTDGQQPLEDCGGSLIRRLREGFGNGINKNNN